jgi:hypothetical protein
MTSGTLTLISYRGREFFDKARAIASLSESDKGYVQVAIFLAGASIEAFVNGRGERALGVSNVEALASVRQSLAISSMVGRQRLVEFRRTNGLDVSALK